MDRFFQSKKSQKADALRTLIEKNEQLYMGPVIYQELLQGIRDDREVSTDCGKGRTEQKEVEKAASKQKT